MLFDLGGTAKNRNFAHTCPRLPPASAYTSRVQHIPSSSVSALFVYRHFIVVELVELRSLYPKNERVLSRFYL